MVHNNLYNFLFSSNTLVQSISILLCIIDKNLSKFYNYKDNENSRLDERRRLINYRNRREERNLRLKQQLTTLGTTDFIYDYSIHYESFDSWKPSIRNYVN